MAEKPQIGRLCCHFLNGEQAIRISVYTGFKGRSQITKIASDFTMAQKCKLSLMRIDQIGQLCTKGIKLGVDLGVEFFRHSAYPLFQVSPFTLERSEEHTSELQSLMRISYAV